MRLIHLAEQYREQADQLRHRIQIVRELPVRSKSAERLQEERLRTLEAMRRDVLDLANLCARYYERGYHHNERYKI